MTQQRAPQPSSITIVSFPRRFSLHCSAAPATLNMKPDSEGSATRVLFHFRPALRSQRTYAPVQVLFQSCARPGRTIIDRASRGRISGERHCIRGTRQCVTHECETVDRTRHCIHHARQPFDSLSIMWPLRDRECIARRFLCVIHTREPNDLFPPVQLLSSLSTIGNPCGINHHPAVQGGGGEGGTGKDRSEPLRATGQSPGPVPAD